MKLLSFGCVKLLSERSATVIATSAQGGSWGFDMLAAQTVLELKEIYPNIYLILVLPCKTQTKYWSDDNKKKYVRILHSADKVVWTSEEYTRDCMFKRNRHLVDTAACASAI